MKMFIVAHSYPQFIQFIRHHFPYLARGIDYERHFICITNEDDVLKSLSMERNMPILFIGGDINLYEGLQLPSPRGRAAVPIHLGVQS